MSTKDPQRSDSTGTDAAPLYLRACFYDKATQPAGVAQWLEHLLAMQKVESSNLFTRSHKVKQRDLALTPGRVFLFGACLIMF